MLRVGLTGGIASGKTTVAGMFAALGVEVVDTDEIAREVVAPGSAALDRITAIFGSDVIASDGTLDRRRLREIVFADDGRRRELEAVLHPLIRQEALARIERAEGAYAIVVVPLLFESGFDQLVDRTVAVDCPEETQIERLTARDRVSRAAAVTVIASQMGRDERRSRADELIDSTAGIEATRQRVAELHASFLELARNCPKAAGRAE